MSCPRMFPVIYPTDKECRDLRILEIENQPRRQYIITIIVVVIIATILVLSSTG